MKVLKFGGTSVGSAGRMRELKKLVCDGEPKLLVLSAMAGTTNSLVEISELIKTGRIEAARNHLDELRGKYDGVINDLFDNADYADLASVVVNTHFNQIAGIKTDAFTTADEKNILACGEMISTALFDLYLRKSDINSILIPALNFMRIDKDGEPDYYYIKENLNRELEECTDAEIIITQGFICRNAAGEVDNLKRGGSDYTASIIGAVLKAEEIQIWTDISGFHNNDPRYVEGTSVLRELSFDEAAELAYFGAKIMHPSAMIPARIYNIPVVIKNTMKPADEGTVIKTLSRHEDYKAVAAKDNITVLRISSDRKLMAFGFMKRVFEVFDFYRTSIDMIATSEVSMSITLDNTDHLVEILADIRKLARVETESDQTIICVVGDFRPERTGSAPEIFEALNSIPVKMISYGASPISLSILIDGSQKVNALQLLHKYIFHSTDV
ncbi:MAG: aspartate kinase [Bacteroidales bacterium]